MDDIICWNLHVSAEKYPRRHALPWYLSVPSVFLFKTHCGLWTPYGDRYLGQHWLREWLVARRHQAITWTNVDLSSVRSCSIHRKALSWEDLKIAINKTRLKITFLESYSDLPGANELTYELHYDSERGCCACSPILCLSHAVTMKWNAFHKAALLLAETASHR